jgi:hypothetical protein
MNLCGLVWQFAPGFRQHSHSWFRAPRDPDPNLLPHDSVELFVMMIIYVYIVMKIAIY